MNGGGVVKPTRKANSFSGTPSPLHRQFSPPTSNAASPNLNHSLSPSNRNTLSNSGDEQQPSPYSELTFSVNGCLVVLGGMFHVCFGVIQCGNMPAVLCAVSRTFSYCNIYFFYCIMLCHMCISGMICVSLVWRGMLIVWCGLLLVWCALGMVWYAHSMVCSWYGVVCS